jgi:hypothetical protein
MNYWYGGKITKSETPEEIVEESPVEVAPEADVI